jgi:copper chaperone CopZ
MNIRFFTLGLLALLCLAAGELPLIFASDIKNLAAVTKPGSAPSVSPSSSVSPSPKALPSSAVSEAPAERWNGFFARASEGKFLIPLKGCSSIEGAPFDRKKVTLVAAYCPKSGRHGIKYLKDQKGDPEKLSLDVETPWEDLSGSVFVLTEGALASQEEEACLLVDAEFERTHSLIKSQPHSGNCSAAVKAAIPNVDGIKNGECTLVSKAEELLVFNFQSMKAPAAKSPYGSMAKEPADGGGDEPEEKHLIGVHDGRDFETFEDAAGFGAFFRGPTGRIRYILYWDGSALGSSIPWLFKELRSGGYRQTDLVECTLYNAAGG